MPLFTHLAYVFVLCHTLNVYTNLYIDDKFTSAFGMIIEKRHRYIYMNINIYNTYGDICTCVCVLAYTI